MKRATCTTCLRSLALGAMVQRSQGTQTCRQCALGHRAADQTRAPRLPDPLNLAARAWRHAAQPAHLAPAL